MRIRLRLVMLLLLGISCAKSPVDEMNVLARHYIDSGRAAEAEQKLTTFWAAHDAAFKDDPQYLLAKAQILHWMNRDQEAWAVFNSVPDDKLTNRSDLFNRLQDRFGEANYSASLSLIQKLAAVDPGFMDEWLHNSLAQFFTADERHQAGRAARIKFLEQLADSSRPVLAEACSGILLWVDAQQAANNPALLAEIANRPTGNQYARAERYRLLIYQILAQHDALRSNAAELLNSTLDVLKVQLNNMPPEVSNREDRARRAYLRYLLAHANFLKAQNAVKANITETATFCFQQAAAFSPDAMDRSVDWAYFYEIHLLHGQEDYTRPFITHLLGLGQIDAALAAFAEHALYYPAKLADFRAFYATLDRAESFADYWQRQTGVMLPKAPVFALQTPDDKTVRLADFQGQWLLLDFWGTWCGPCVAETPLIQQLHETFAAATGNVHLLAIACRDRREAVTNFMAKNGLSYPAVLSDGQVQGDFRVVSYPTKVLVFPNGHYVELSHDRDWLDYLRAYLAEEQIGGLDKIAMN